MENQNNIAKKEENQNFKFESSIKTGGLKCLQCNSCEFLSYFQHSLDSHICITKPKFNCPASSCKNLFTCNESLSSHLLCDHNVQTEEIEFFIGNWEKPNQKIHIVDYQLLKKPDVIQPKSKIFIKDVTLLRKPELPHNDIAIPNIFDSLDLTTTEDDIFDDFLGPDDQIFDADFDFDESANLNNVVECIETPEPIPELEILTPTQVGIDLLSGKISVRKNLCGGEVADEVPVEETIETEIPTSKIYVRSHESLTSVFTTNVTHQPPEASTPDCVIVSEVEAEAPTSKIFIRNIETLTNPQQEDPNQYFVTATNDSFLNNYTNYVRNFESPVDGSRPEHSTTPSGATQTPPPRCKISIKNMNTLIEPILMQPPLNASSMIFGQAQNLVIHMRPQQADESLLSYRDSSMTPDTLPGSSNVSTCGGNDDVIILDDTDTIFSASEIPDQIIELMAESHVEETPSTLSTAIENPEKIEIPERIETPNEKNVLQKLEIQKETILPAEESNAQDKGEQPMVRIPIDFNDSNNEPIRKRVKIVKIIRIKKKRKENCPSNQNAELSSSIQLSNIQVVFRCSHQDCNQHFSSEQLLKYHRKCHSANESLVCPECRSEEYKSFNTLHTHLWRAHKVDMELYSCELCDFKTPILSRLKNFHAKIHSEEKKYKCNFTKCGKSFKNSKQLKNHSQTHKTRVKVLKVVKETIPVENDCLKRMQCSECGKGFSSESGLYIHSMEHKIDEKKFNCEECDYSTNDHNSIRRHKSQHSQVHQYKCPGPACEYTSIQSSTYRKHLEKQHPELAESLLFKCGFCKFTTISKAKYDGHLVKHCVSAENRQKPKKLSNKIKVKSNLLLTDPSIHCNVLMKNLLPNQAGL